MQANKDLGLSDSRGWKRLSVGPGKTWFVTLQISEGNKISHCNYISSGWYVNSGFGNWVKSWLCEGKWIEIYSALDLGTSDSKYQSQTSFFSLLHQFISRMIPSESFQIDMGMYEAKSSTSYSSTVIYNQEALGSCKHWSMKSAKLHCELGSSGLWSLSPSLAHSSWCRDAMGGQDTAEKGHVLHGLWWYT